MNSTPKMRTIRQAIKEIRESDPQTAFSEKALRRLVNTGTIAHVDIGQKYLIDLNSVNEYLRGGMSK